MPGVVQKSSNLINLQEHRYWHWDSRELDLLIEGLVDVSHATEESFLQLGAKIRLFHDRADGISKAAGEAMQLLHGDDGENTVQQLQLLVERCSLWLASSADKSTNICVLLNDVVKQMAGFYEPIFGLRKVIKTLHTLRVSTRIEAAKGYASGAGVLAKSLDHLGNLAHEKIAEIAERTEALVPMIEKSLAMEEAAQSGTIRIASREVKNARDLLNAFMANFIQTGQWTDRLKERSEDVRQSFGEMISALQFQDITRQRFEHVQSALTALGDHLERFSKRSDSSRDEEAARLFGRICRLQYNQLNLASQEFFTAADNLTGNLQGMVANIVSMADDTRALSSATDVGRDSRYATVLDALKSITDHLDETRHVHSLAGTHLAEVCQRAQAVAELVAEVELIGEEIQLLSMNAAISAAHARRQGAGLDIIAQNIHAVAADAARHATVLASECAKITSHAEQLQSVGLEAQSGSGNVGTLLDEAQNYISKIGANSIKLMDLATEVDQTTVILSDDVHRTVSTIDVRKSFQEKLAPALERLGHISSPFDEKTTEADNANLAALFSDLEHCYTMDSERRVHKRFIARDDSPSTEAMPEADEWSANRNHGLGDNIDLF